MKRKTIGSIGLKVYEKKNPFVIILRTFAGPILCATMQAFQRNKMIISNFVSIVNLIQFDLIFVFFLIIYFVVIYILIQFKNIIVSIFIVSDLILPNKWSKKFCNYLFF